MRGNLGATIPVIDVRQTIRNDARMRPDDFTLKPHHIVEASLAFGQTHFVIRLPTMTWSANLIGHDGNLYGIIRDEHDVPLEDGHQILNWILDQPHFVRRIWELAVERGNSSAVEKGQYSGRW